MNVGQIIDRIDRRVIYVMIALSLALPLYLGTTLPPAPMTTAEQLFKAVENVPRAEDKLVLLAFDYGPGTQAENRSQSAVVIEHLMRRHIPFGIISLYQYAAPFMEEVPNEIARRLAEENPGEVWAYGKDWVNLGYRPGGGVAMIQGLAKAADLRQVLATDAAGTPLTDIPCMKNIATLKNISLFGQFTGLVGTFNAWVQFLQSGEYRPPFVHGCTSITIPEAYIYYSSGQIIGLLEGVAGAAWYEELLSKQYTTRKKGIALRINTSLGVAHLVIIAFILLGNAGYLIARYSERRSAA